MRKRHSFDYSKAKPNRFAGRLGEEIIAVVLDPDVAAVFTTPEKANQALRVLIGALQTWPRHLTSWRRPTAARFLWPAQIVA